MENFDLQESVESSMAVLNFQVTETALTDNPDFVKAWAIARVKARETMILAQAMLILKRKCNISDLDFELMLEGFDQEDIIWEDKNA